MQIIIGIFCAFLSEYLLFSNISYSYAKNDKDNFEKQIEILQNHNSLNIEKFNIDYIEGIKHNR